MSKKWDEIIIAVDRELLFDGEKDAFQGILVDNEDKINRITKRLESFIEIRRGHRDDPTPKENNSEINFGYKQPIPYAIVRKGDNVFLYKRLSQSGEIRLFNKLSIGIGGHMNLELGSSFGDIILTNLLRELDEELEIDAAEMQLSVIGLINDDSDDVGKVHLGLLTVIDLEENSTVEVKEKDQLEGEWITIGELLKEENYIRLENWSQIALKALE